MAVVEARRRLVVIVGLHPPSAQGATTVDYGGWWKSDRARERMVFDVSPLFLHVDGALMIGGGRGSSTSVVMQTGLPVMAVVRDRERGQRQQ